MRTQVYCSLAVLLASLCYCNLAISGEPGDIFAEWTINAIAGEVVPVDIDASITFSGEDRLLAKAGCNNLVSRFIMDENRLELAMVMSTQMMCEDAIMAQERNLAEALQSIHSFSVEGNSLVIMDEAGNEILSASR
jgi:heat shock protein HslJ